MLLLHVESKYVVPATPSGWTLGLSKQGGSGSSGVDSGLVYATIFYKIADGGETGNLTVSDGSVNAMRCVMMRYTKDNTKTWLTPAFVGGASNTPGTSWSATMDSDVGITAGDYVVVGSAMNCDTVTWTLEALSATGVVFGTMSERNDGSTASGDDLGQLVCEFPITSGTSSAAAVFTATGSATVGANGPAGATVLCRLREGAVQARTTFAEQGTVAAGTTSIALPYPTTGLASGDIFIMEIGGKYSPNTPTTPSGWTLIASKTTVDGAPGVGGDGPVYLYVYYKIASGSESGNVSVTVTGGNCVAGRITRYRPYNSSATISFGSAVAMTDVEATSHSWTFDADPGEQTDDLVILCLGVNNQSGGSFTLMAQTGGTAKLDGPREESPATNVASTTNGDDVSTRRYEAWVRTGTTSGAPTITATSATAFSVAAILVRIRETVVTAIHHPNQGIFRGIFGGVQPHA